MVASASTSAAGHDPAFADYHLVEFAIRSLKVKDLKNLIGDVNKAFSGTNYLRLSGNKAELANRIIGVLVERKAARDVRGFQMFKELVVENGGHIPTTSSAGNAARAKGSVGGIPAEKANGSSPYGGAFPSAATTASSTPASMTARSVAAINSASRVNFKSSPFWEIKHFISNMVMCPEAPTNTDRKNATIYVSFNNDHISLLKRTDVTYQARLFCTTHESYAVALSGRFPAPVEFPLTCEARVNGYPLSTNLRGSKKNAGRVPPPNLNKDGHLIFQPQRQNRIELTYTNCQKKHVLIVGLCEVTSAEVLVERLRKKAYRSKEEVLSSMKKAAEDDDIQAGSATMSLKCPLSYMRMTTPCRSNQCPHVQCFDALSFFSVNEQSPSWSCPVCNQTIKPEDVLMDGYVDDILKRVSDDHDSVIVEPDGSWRTQDGKIASDGYAAAPAVAAGLGSASVPATSSAEPRSEAGREASSSRGPPTDNIVILDSPSPPPTGPLAPAATASRPPAPAPITAATGSSMPPAGPAAATAAAGAGPEVGAGSDSSGGRPPSNRPAPEPTVIDLTFSDSDEDGPVPPVRPRQPPPAAPPASMQPPFTFTAGAGIPPAAMAASMMGRAPLNGHLTNGSSNGGLGVSEAAAARRYSQDARAGASAAERDGTDPPSDEDAVRRPGKRARVEAAQGAGSGRPRNQLLESEDSPVPRSAAGSGGGSSMANGNAASAGGPSAGSSGGRDDGGSGTSQRYLLPNAGSTRPDLEARPHRLPDRRTNRPSYPISYLDTDIGNDAETRNGWGSSPLSAYHEAQGRGARDMRNSAWGDDSRDNSRAYEAGGGRDTYFADDDWW
ncbi:E3 SUMO-protein ligase pli1 [Thecaphora frezii]